MLLVGPAELLVGLPVLLSGLPALALLQVGHALLLVEASMSLALLVRLVASSQRLLLTRLDRTALESEPVLAEVIPAASEAVRVGL